MQKLSFILFLLIVCTGCSVIRTNSNRSTGLSKDQSPEGLLEGINKQNVSGKGFFIQKAEIEITTAQGKERVLGSIKHISPDIYLVSIKSRTGLEVVRIYLTEDTILINDRINKKQFFGSPEYLKKKYVISALTIPLLVGDYIAEKQYDISQQRCLNGILKVDSNIEGININYFIDCKKKKVISAEVKSKIGDKGVKINFNDFIKFSKGIVPGKIEILNFQDGPSVVIVIKKIETPWNGNLEFIPGKNYELIQLL